jgi:Sodium:solute symporter family
MLVSAMLVLGGAAVVTAISGMNIYACMFLIPVGVLCYTCAGGLKATFMASYINTAIIYIALVIFTLKIYASSERAIGSPSAVRSVPAASSSARCVLKRNAAVPFPMLSKCRPVCELSLLATLGCTQCYCTDAFTKPDMSVGVGAAAVAERKQACGGQLSRLSDHNAVQRCAHCMRAYCFCLACAAVNLHVLPSLTR